MYSARSYSLSALEGLSDRTLETHFKLYEGYVQQTNQLQERLFDLLKGGRIAPIKMALYSEFKRRLGFEYNGMILHEYYFENLKKGGGGTPAAQSPFLKAAAESFGSFELWKADFCAVGGMRGVGWAVCYLDPAAQRLSNHWISLHHDGNIAGYRPLLVMDVWEHAYLLDYPPAEKSSYIEAFFANVHWEIVDERCAK